MRPGPENPFTIFQDVPHFSTFSPLQSVCSVLLNLCLLGKWNKILQCLLKILWSELISGKYITKWNTPFYDLKDKCQTNILRMNSCQEAEEGFVFGCGQPKRICRKAASFLSLESDSVNDDVKCIFRHIFPSYLCWEVHCLVKCQSAAFSVGAIFHLNALKQDFHGKYSSSARHLKLFLMPL